MMGLPILAKMSDINHKHNEMVRYSLWERTVWTSARKSDAQLAQEVEQRFMNHPAVALTTQNQFSNPFWQHQGRTILAGDGNADNSTLVSFRYDGAPRENVLVGINAHSNPLANLGLNGNGLATVTLQTRILDRYDENNDNRYIADTNSAVNLESTASILTDTWSATSEGDFQGSIDSLTPVHEALELLTVPAPIIAGASVLLPINLLEGFNGNDVENSAYTEAIDSQFIRAKP